MKAGLLAAGDYFAPLADDAPLPALDAALREVGAGSFRRIDRFVQLALLGAARCARGHNLRPGCGVYIGSSLGPLSSNIRVQETMLGTREWPMPFHFVNTLGSSAGFYIASSFNLSGPSLFVSRRGASLAAVLETALTDLATGVVEQALVGVVEEAPLPLAAQRRRLAVAADMPLAEGSHWLLLGGVGDRATHSVSFSREPDVRGLSVAGACCAGRGLGDAVPAGYMRLDGLPWHDSIEAAWFVARAAEARRNVALLNRDDGGGYLVRLGA